MIQINLLPGAGRKSRKGPSPKLDVGAAFSGIRDRVRDPWPIGAIASVVVCSAVVAGLMVTQNAREASLEEQLLKAVQDSTRYSSVLREREVAEAKRDTVVRSLNMIRAIDDDRYIWPHVMDEVSRALPPYTWLVSLGFSGSGQAQAPVATVVAAATADSAAGGRKKKKALNTAI